MRASRCFVVSALLVSTGIVPLTGQTDDAIRTAIAELKAGDTLLIAGKGHETGQIVGDTVLPFSDQETAKAALEEVSA